MVPLSGCTWKSMGLPSLKLWPFDGNVKTGPACTRVAGGVADVCAHAASGAAASARLVALRLHKRALQGRRTRPGRLCVGHGTGQKTLCQRGTGDSNEAGEDNCCKPLHES